MEITTHAEWELTEVVSAGGASVSRSIYVERGGGRDVLTLTSRM